MIQYQEAGETALSQVPTVTAKKAPGWILAVLPRFRYSFILLLIESRRRADACVMQYNGNRMREFSKLGNTASKQPGSRSENNFLKVII